MSPKKIHFHSFDAFRFFAFFKVFIFHLPLILVADNDAFKVFFYDHIKHGGGVGVSFFFVLSGFLITYILTFEKLHSGKINLKRFFVRRAFRIWPLFYLVVITVLLLPPDFAESIGCYHPNWQGYIPDWRFSLSFTENYKSILMDGGPLKTPLSVFWSLCIEEHFYIVWMLVFFFIKRKAIPYFLLFTVVTAWFFRIFEQDIYHTVNTSNADLFTNLDYFSVSGLLGYFVATNYKKIASFVNRIPIWVKYAYIGFVALILLNQKAIFMHDIWVLNIFKYTFFSLLFALLLLIFIPQNSKIRISEKNIFTKLGKISYGLYVYHLIWIHVLLKLLKNNAIVLDNWPNYIAFACITFVGTVAMSYVSYRYFEMPILKYREKFFKREG